MSYPVPSSLRSLRLLGLLGMALVVSCAPVRDDDDDDATDPIDFRLWSPDLIDDSAITHTYDCDQALPLDFACGEANPEIRWEGVPEEAVALALIFDDPTGFSQPFPHWAIFNIPSSEDGFAAGISGNGLTSDIPDGATQLVNGGGWAGYFGSCPSGINLYRWRLWALDSELDTDSGDTYSALEADAEDAAISVVEMCHVFDGSVLPQPGR